MTLKINTNETGYIKIDTNMYTRDEINEYCTSNGYTIETSKNDLYIIWDQSKNPFRNDIDYYKNFWKELL